MSTDTDRYVQAVFARLDREHPTLTDIDRSLMTAFERLMLDRPEITDGRTTVTNICTEAGVSRASYYRSPAAAAIKEILETPQVKRPELDELRAEIARLKKAERDLRADKATEIRELTATVNVYGNQIQALAVRNAELEDELQRLRKCLAENAPTIRVLPIRQAESTPAL